jgi:isoleucyl-tRNA synthetase
MAQTPPKNDQKTLHALREERILAFWKENKIFEKTLEKTSPKGEFTFYDGPPFANGLPHYGHILAGMMKDVIPRFKTMQGYHVTRRWGWDCHGLPVENLIEKELGLKSKKDILEYGIGKFNEAAGKSVMKYADEWRKIVPRLGRFVDMDDDYRTMDATYTESVWWIFKNLYDKGLIYEGFKAMNLCPRCETTLSNFEVAQGYKDITDISVYVKFRILGGVNGKTNNAAETSGNTYFIAWTTTAWTLPGNVALAVSANMDYVKVRLTGNIDIAIAKEGDVFIIAESRLATTFKDKSHKVIEKMKGRDLIGMSYEPLFDYYANDKSLKDRENGWKVYGANFVTMEDGTGIVHIAPAFGADDYELLVEHALPFVQHVAVDGTFKKEVKDFPGLHVKPIDTEKDKNAHQSTDIEVIKWLAHNNRLFEKEKIVHSYPHCWRCETPLINYATSSWFVKVTNIKDKLVAVNKKISWVPPEVGEGRFGNWLEGARDWAISRSRFWGAPIPVWREVDENRSSTSAASSSLHVIGSVADLKKYSKAKNTYFVMRHGQCESNINNVLNGDINVPNHLTELGKEQARKAAKSIKDLGFDVIIASPFMRTRETANIVMEEIGFPKDKLITDERLCERKMGVWEGKTGQNYDLHFEVNDFFVEGPKGGENNTHVRNRVGDFLYDMEKKYSGKKILVITHAGPALLLISVAQAFDKQQATAYEENDYFRNAEVRPLNFSPLPHNAEYELDLHRPFIDELDLRAVNGNKLIRVPDVFDCWFESGAMPMASHHYPFENLDKFNPESNFLSKICGGLCKNLGNLCKGSCCGARAYPADFIAEGLDQTRGWFYSMLVLGVALFGTSPYKKVLVNGMVLAEDGEKMSKSKKNYPDPMLVAEKYSADSLRYYLMSSPVVHAQDLCFSERGVDEVTKKIVNRLLNVVSFYEMYAGEISNESTSSNILDQWIISRLNETIAQVTSGLEAGELDRASRPILDLVDDLSTWYLRRSRDRFKGDDIADKNAALNTTKTVLLETAKIMAPFMPFIAEDIYQRVSLSAAKSDRDHSAADSIHLKSWPTAGKIDSQLLQNMKRARIIASQGLEARMAAKINVRQPLQMLKVKEPIGSLGQEFISIISDEVNVKVVTFGTSSGRAKDAAPRNGEGTLVAKTDAKREITPEMVSNVELDTNITPSLKEEGTVRELIRAIQDLRKEKGLTINDRATLIIEIDNVGRKFVEKNKEMISRQTLLKDIEWRSVGEIESTKIGEFTVKLGLK